MSVGLFLLLLVGGFVLFAVVVSRLAPRMARGTPDVQVEQEMVGVGADQKEDPTGPKEPPMR